MSNDWYTNYYCQTHPLRQQQQYGGSLGQAPPIAYNASMYANQKDQRIQFLEEQVRSLEEQNAHMQQVMAANEKLQKEVFELRKERNDLKFMNTVQKAESLMNEPTDIAVPVDDPDNANMKLREKLQKTEEDLKRTKRKLTDAENSLTHAKNLIKKYDHLLNGIQTSRAELSELAVITLDEDDIVVGGVENDQPKSATASVWSAAGDSVAQANASLPMSPALVESFAKMLTEEDLKAIESIDLILP